MELGFGRDLPFSKGIAQEAKLHERFPSLKVWVKGRGAESLDACLTAFRKRPGTLYIAGDLRIIGDKDKQESFLAAYRVFKEAKVIIHDIVNDERSDRDGVEMQRRAASMLQYSNAMGGSRKTARVRGSKGGRTKGQLAALKRAEKMPEEAVRALIAMIGKTLTWRDVADITGFSTATLRRHYLKK